MGNNMPMGGQQMGQPMPQMTNGMPVPQGQRMPQAPMPNMMPPQAPMPNAMQAQNPVAAQYLGVTSKLIPSITERNPYLKERVGEAIFPFIKNLVGNDRVPKITGMLIELPVEQIKQYMCSYENLCCKVKEADDLINQSEKQ